MIGFGSEIHLLKVDSGPVVGLSNGPNVDQFFVTTANSVVMFQINSQKPLTSWNASFGQTLQSPVAYDSSDDSLLVGNSDNEVIKWKTTKDRIDKGVKTTVAGVVRKIWPLNGISNFVLEYDDDTTAFWTSPLQKIKPELPETHVVKLIHVLEDGQVAHVIFVSCGENSNLLHIWTFNQDGDKKSDKIFSFPNINGATPTRLHVIPEAQDTLKVNTLWSNGLFCRGSVNYSNLTFDWHKCPPVEELQNGHLYSTAFLKNHVVITISKENGDCICIMYSLKFSIVVARRTLEINAAISQIQMHSFNDNVIILLGNEIILLPISIDSENLSLLIGIKASGKTADNFEFNKKLYWTTSGLTENVVKENIFDQSKDRGFSKKLLSKVQFYESLGRSEQMICIDMLQEIQKEKDFDMLSEVLRYFRIIPESVVADALHFYLSSRMDCELLFSNGIDDSELHEHLLINQILNIHVETTFLVDHLKKFPLNEVTFLLSYLHSVLMRQDSSIIDPIQVVCWISALLDSHFHLLVMTKDEKLAGLLYSLHENITDQCNLFEDMTAIQSSFQALFDSRKHFTLREDLPYCIQTIIFE